MFMVWNLEFISHNSSLRYFSPSSYSTSRCLCCQDNILQLQGCSSSASLIPSLRVVSSQWTPPHSASLLLSVAMHKHQPWYQLTLIDSLQYVGGGYRWSGLISAESKVPKTTRLSISINLSVSKSVNGKPARRLSGIETSCLRPAIDYRMRTTKQGGSAGTRRGRSGAAAGPLRPAAAPQAQEISLI